MKANAKKDGKKPGVRDAIKAIQDIPRKNLKCKKTVVVESSDNELMEKDLVTPKPCKKNAKSRAQAPESDVDSDLPAPPKRVVRQPVLIDSDEGDNSREDLPPKGAKKNKGKGKAIQQADNKGKTTAKGADQTQGGNVPKLKMYAFPSYPHSIILSHVSTFIE